MLEIKTFEEFTKIDEATSGTVDAKYIDIYIKMIKEDLDEIPQFFLNSNTDKIKIALDNCMSNIKKLKSKF